MKYFLLQLVGTACFQFYRQVQLWREGKLPPEDWRFHEPFPRYLGNPEKGTLKSRYFSKTVRLAQVEMDGTFQELLRKTFTQQERN